jgi:putative transcriptional regulator
VVFVIEHDDEGAVGLVLNRPTGAALSVAVPEWARFAAAPAVAFVGGPVQQDDAMIGLAEVAGAEVAELVDADGWQPLLGHIGTLDLGRSPEAVLGRLHAVRVFVGYSGWGPGQLDDELAQGGWYVVDAEPTDLLTSDPASLWRRVLRRQGGDLAVAANYPVDLQNN